MAVIAAHRRPQQLATGWPEMMTAIIFAAKN
jgi:hypothetical protein